MTLSPALLFLALAGCVTDLGTLSRLQQAYGQQTVDQLDASLEGTMALGAVAVQACLAVGDGSWQELAAGGTLPLSEQLVDIIGAPLVESYQAGTVMELVVSPVSLAQVEDARLLMTVVAGAPVQVGLQVTDAAGETVLGEADLEVAADCSDDWARLSGSATWTLDELEQDLTLPAEGSGSAGVDWPGVVAWLPGAGVVGWQGRIGGELRSFVSADASTIEANGLGGYWAGTASGLEWSTAVTADLQP